MKDIEQLKASVMALQEGLREVRAESEFRTAHRGNRFAFMEVCSVILAVLVVAGGATFVLEGRISDTNKRIDDTNTHLGDRINDTNALIRMVQSDLKSDIEGIEMDIGGLERNIEGLDEKLDRLLSR